jgi:hypothetical protein
VLGVPFEVVPFKATAGTPAPEPPKRHHVYAIPSKAEYEIRFPREQKDDSRTPAAGLRESRKRPAVALNVVLERTRWMAG